MSSSISVRSSAGLNGLNDGQKVSYDVQKRSAAS